VQHFHQRFHGTADVAPSAKALTQARALLARYGLEQARYLVDFSVTAAQETDYRPQTFGGILQYTARARADYAQAQERALAEERAREERRRAQADAHLRRQYEDERTARLAQLRATTPPAVLAAIEEAAAAQFEREHTSPFGRALLRQYAMDDAVAAYFQLPSFAEWQAAQDPREGNGDETP
jgi:restriction endonuclease Mrr